jgi:hypothetical protein
MKSKQEQIQQQKRRIAHLEKMLQEWKAECLHLTVIAETQRDELARMNPTSDHPEIE